MGEKKKAMLTAVILVLLILAAVIAYQMLRSQTDVPEWVSVGGSTEESAGSEGGEAGGSGTEETDGSGTEETGGNGAGETAAETETEPGAESDGEETEADRMEAFDFTVYDGEGNEVRLSDYEGTVVLMNFWATWCGYCVSEMPAFQQIYEEYGDQIQVMMINATDGNSETQDTAMAYIEEEGYTFPVFYDLQYDACYQYGVTGLPMTVIVGADGYIAGYARGAVSYDILKNALDQIIGQQRP